MIHRRRSAKTLLLWLGEGGAGRSLDDLMVLSSIFFMGTGMAHSFIHLMRAVKAFARHF